MNGSGSVFAAFAVALACAFTVDADLAERGDSVEVLACDEHEADGRDERVDLVDHDTLPAAQEAADLRVVPTDRLLYVVAPGAVQRLAQGGFDASRGSHSSMTRNTICVQLSGRADNLGPVLLNAFEIDQARDAGCRAVLDPSELLEHVTFVGHQAHIDGLAGQHAARRTCCRRFLQTHGGILPVINLAQAHCNCQFGKFQ